MAWSEQMAVNRIVGKIGQAICAAAYALHVEHGMSARDIGRTLGVNAQTAASAVRAGRTLNAADAFAGDSLVVARVILRDADYMASTYAMPDKATAAILTAGILADRDNANRIAGIDTYAKSA